MAGKMKAQQEVQEQDQEIITDTLPDLEGEDGTELAFLDGPTKDQVEDWRSRYKDVYLTDFEEGEVIVWRSLLRKEYKEIMKIPNADNYYKEERICERVVLWPENYGHLIMAQGKAGIPTLIAELVMEKSGFQARTGAMRL